MKTLRALSVVAALFFTSTDASAQACLGLPMRGRNYIGADHREVWTGHGRQAPVWGGQYAHAFGPMVASIGGGAGGMKGDTTAIHVSGMLSTGMLLPQISENLSLCAGLGFDAQMTDYSGESRNDADGFGSLPLTLGLGYDVRLGALTVTPFAAPTLAYYGFESENYKNGARQWGWDTYVTMGATASFSRYSVGASYRNGDRSLGQSGRFSFSTGVSF